MRVGDRGLEGAVFGLEGENKAWVGVRVRAGVRIRAKGLGLGLG